LFICWKDVFINMSSLIVKYVRDLIEGGKSNDEVIALLKKSNSGLSDDRIHQFINEARDDLKTVPKLDPRLVEQVRKNSLTGHTKDILTRSGIKPEDFSKYYNVKSAAQSEYVFNAATKIDPRLIDSIINSKNLNNSGLKEFYNRSNLLGFPLPDSREATSHHLLRFAKARKLATGGLSGINLIKSSGSASKLLATNALEATIQEHVKNKELYEKYLFYAPRLKNESNLIWKMKQLGISDDLLSTFASMRGPATGRFYMHDQSGRRYFAEGGYTGQSWKDYLKQQAIEANLKDIKFNDSALRFPSNQGFGINPADIPNLSSLKLNEINKLIPLKRAIGGIVGPNYQLRDNAMKRLMLLRNMTQSGQRLKDLRQTAQINMQLGNTALFRSPNTAAGVINARVLNNLTSRFSGQKLGKFASGGNVPKSGGKFVGKGSITSDSIAATLPNGYVIPGSTIRAMGRGYFDNLTGNKSFIGNNSGMPAMVSNGEYFLGEPTVRAMGGSGWFDSLLSMTRDSSLSPKEANKLGINRFAAGGGVGDALKTFVSHYFNPYQKTEQTTGANIRVVTRGDFGGEEDILSQESNRKLVDTFEEQLQRRLETFFKGTIDQDDILQRLTVTIGKKQYTTAAGNVGEEVTLQPKFKWSEEDATKLGLTEKQMREQIEQTMTSNLYGKSNEGFERVRPLSGINIGTLKTTEKALMGVNGQYTRMGKFSGMLKDLSFRLASVSMSAMGVYFSTMGLFTAISQGVTAITDPLKDIETLTQNIGVVKAFGSSIGFGSEQLKYFGVNSKDLVETWKKVTATGAATQVMFADLGNKVFGDGRVLTAFNKTLQDVFKSLGEKGSINIFKDFLITIIQSIPTAVDALKTMQSAIQVLADQPLAMKALMWAVAMSMVVQPVVSLGSAFLTLTGMAAGFANSSNNAVYGIQAMTKAMTGLNSRILAASLYVLALLAAWEAVARIANTVGLKNELAPSQVLPKLAGDIMGGVGEKIGGFAKGGLVGGSGDGDDDANVVKLSRGEYVINARAAKRLGKDTLDQLNGYALGGSPFTLTPEGSLDITETRYFGNKNIDLNSTMMKDTANMADVMTTVRQGRDLRVYVTNGSELMGGTGLTNANQPDNGLPFEFGGAPELQDMNIVPAKYSMRIPDIKIPDILKDAGRWISIKLSGLGDMLRGAFDWIKVRLPLGEWLKAVSDWFKGIDFTKLKTAISEGFTKLTNDFIRFGTENYKNLGLRYEGGQPKYYAGDIVKGPTKTGWSPLNVNKYNALGLYDYGYNLPEIGKGGGWSKLDVVKAALYGGGNLGKVIPDYGTHALGGAMPDPGMILNVLGTAARTKDIGATITEGINQTVTGALTMGGIGVAHYGGAWAASKGMTGTAVLLGGGSRLAIGAGTLGTEAIPLLGMMEAGSAWSDYKRGLKTAEELKQQQGVAGMFTGSMGSTSAAYAMEGDRNAVLARGQMYENMGKIYDFINPLGVTGTIGKALDTYKQITNALGVTGGYDEQGNAKFGIASGAIDFLTKGITSNELFAGSAFAAEGAPQVLNSIAGMVTQLFNSNQSNINTTNGIVTNYNPNVPVVNGMQYVGKTEDLINAAELYQQQEMQVPTIVTNYITITATGVDDLENKVRDIMKSYGITTVMRR